MSEPSSSLTINAASLPPRHRWWIRRHPRWAMAIAAFVVLAIAGAAEFLWIALPIGSHNVPGPTVLPTSWDEDRIFVEPKLANGERLRLLADTGGGTFLNRAAVERCGLAVSWSIGRGDVTRLDNLRREAWIPEPVGGQRSISVRDGEGDSMLGQRWFAGGAWTFDYPGKRLILSNSPFQPTQVQAAHSVDVGFPSWMGLRSGNHPRITVKIADQSIEALFDTGATLRLTKQAVALIADGHASERATSFISGALFDRLHREHPEWRYVEKAEQDIGSPIVEVPVVEIAGLAAGPAWFTRREDANYQWMSSYTDKPIQTSIGGNVLKQFRVVLDYPAGIAYFERGTD